MSISMVSRYLHIIMVILAISALLLCVWSSQHRRFIDYQSLMAAIYANNTSAVRAALDHGTNVNDVSVDEGMLPLAVAAQEGNIEIVRLLLDHGADINGFDGWQSPLSAAADHDQTAIIELLIARGALGRDDALMRAAINGKVAAVRVLLAHGANPNSVTNKEEKTLLYTIERNHHPDVAALLRKAGAK